MGFDGGDDKLNRFIIAATIAGTTCIAEDGQTVAINISSSAGGGTPINTTASVQRLFRLACIPTKATAATITAGSR